MLSIQSAGDRFDPMRVERTRRPQITNSPFMIAPIPANDIVMPANEVVMPASEVVMLQHLMEPSLPWPAVPTHRQHLQHRAKQTEHEPLSRVYSPRKRHHRPWERRIQRELEVIQSCQILRGSNSFSPSHPGFTTVDRVLFSRLLPQSFIYQHFLLSLGHTYETIPIPKYATRFGWFEPIGFACVFVNTTDDIAPIVVDFLVLPGSPPTGGVSFMLGSNYLPHNHRGSSASNQHMPDLLPPDKAMAALMLGSPSFPPMVAEGLGVAHGEAEDLLDLSSPPFNQTADDHNSCLHAPNNDISSWSTTYEESRILAPLSWKSEFSWHSQRLVLDGEDLPTGRAAGPSSEVSIVRVGGTGDPPRSESTAQEGVPALGSETLPLEPPVQGESGSRNAERINVLVSLLEKHYWKTHPAKGPTQGNGSQGRWAPTPPMPNRQYAKLAAQPYPGAPKKGKGIDNGSGGGNDGEEDDDGGTNSIPSRPRTLKQPTDYFACPFLKWDPWRYYNTCKARHPNISNVILHLQAKHYELQCAPCNRELTSPEEKNRHLQPHFPGIRRPEDRPAIISEAKWAQIKEPPVRNGRYGSSNQRDRWNVIFDILFPTFRATHGIHPFLTTAEGEILEGLIRYIRREGLQELRRHQDRVFGANDHRIMEEEISAAVGLFISRIFSQLVREFTSGDIAVPEPETVQGGNVVNLPPTGEAAPSPHDRIGGAAVLPRPHKDNQQGLLAPHHYHAASPLGYGNHAVTSPTDTSMALTMGTSIAEIANDAGETPRAWENDVDWGQWINEPKAIPDSDPVEFTGFGTWDQSEGADYGMAGVNPDGNNNPIVSPTSMNLDAEHLQIHSRPPIPHHGILHVPPGFSPPDHPRIQTSSAPPLSRNGVGGIRQPIPIPTPPASHGTPATRISQPPGPTPRGLHRTHRSTRRESPIAPRPGGSRIQRRRNPGLNRASSSDVRMADYDPTPLEDPKHNYR